MQPVELGEQSVIKLKSFKIEPENKTSTSNNSEHNNIKTEIVKFKCEVSGCLKEFANRHRLKKHTALHNKASKPKPIKQSIECPVKKTTITEACAQTYTTKEDLLKHLSEDHGSEDAPYHCELCGRHFFWLPGLRAHTRSHTSPPRARIPLPCTWPGCTRVFFQACRLKEHSRAHTGDKPYPCNFPNCGWSFRTASKLLRHARRHTGDRRHECRTCGRAFLRGEHLRQHLARHLQPHTRLRHPCTQEGCEHSFTNMSSLYLHIKRFHNKKEKKKTSNVLLPVKEEWLASNNSIFLNELETESEDDEAEWHAARTHCTWPLSTFRSETEPLNYDQEADTYKIYDDRTIQTELSSVQQVEFSDGGDNNIFTVRSDLFLHGSVLQDDFQYGESGSMELVFLENGVTALDVGSCHGLELFEQPQNDLLQEQLLYTDAVMEESSFQVLLLNGDEINHV